MKLTALTLLSNSAILALTAVTPSPNTAYQLKVLSQTPALKDTVLTVKDDSSANAFPIPLGVFSTGEPRAPYKFTFSPSTAGEGLYELKGTLRQTHLIITGDPRAMGFFEAPIGGDPQPAANETQFTNKWMVFSSGDGMNLVFAEGLAAGSWRACKGDSELDYTFYFFDGRSELNAIIKGCESVSLQVVEATSSLTTLTGVVAPTATNGIYITGVPSPSASMTGAWLSGVTAPAATSLSNASSTAPSPTQSAFEGATSRLSIVGTLMSFVIGLATLMV